MNKTLFSLILFTSIYLVTGCSPVFAHEPKPKEDEQTEQIHKNSEEKSKKAVDWGEWNTELPPKAKYGVGIQGSIEDQLSKLDKSNLIDDAGGVATKKGVKANPSNKKKPKNIKQMMAELEAMENEVKKELNDDSEF